LNALTEVPMVPNAEIKDEIEKVVHSQIHSSDILNVSVDRGTDADGDQLIFVHVIFDSKAKQIDTEEAMAVRRLVRNRFIELGEAGFPIFYFIAKSEAGKLSAAN